MFGRLIHLRSLCALSMGSTQLRGGRHNEGLHFSTPHPPAPSSPGSEGLMNDYFSLCNTTGCWSKGQTPRPPPPGPPLRASSAVRGEEKGSALQIKRTPVMLLYGDLWVLASTWDYGGCSPLRLNRIKAESLVTWLMVTVLYAIIPLFFFYTGVSFLREFNQRAEL